MAAGVSPPDLPSLLAPILPALPTATIATQPAEGILPLLSPILRQRVQLFSASSTEPWLRLLCYDKAKAVRLQEAVGGGQFEPHPVSGEVEVDWGCDVRTRYRRLDQETLQAFAVLSELGVAFQLVYCVGDREGGGDGWRVGEVTVPDTASPFAQFGGASTISEAEAQFKDSKAAVTNGTTTTKGHAGSLAVAEQEDDDDDDDDDGYWGRYDATPARTPADNRSPAPQARAAAANVTSTAAARSGTHQTSTLKQEGDNDDDDDDDYYAQYDEVQPAMDNHDPDEAAQLAHIEPPLGLSRTSKPALDSPSSPKPNSNRGSWTFAELDKSSSSSSRPLANQHHGDNDDDDDENAIHHPRPESSASSTGPDTVARLEASAGKREQNEFGVKQHVSRSIRSLYLLARSSGIERDEFERLVKTELNVLSMIEDQD